MKILLDHCVPKRARTLLPGHNVLTCAQAGLSNLSNGVLLLAAAETFDVLLTTDKGFRHQHNLSTLPLPVIEIDTLFTRFVDLQPIAFAFEAALLATRDCRFVSIGEGGVIERVAPAA